METPNQFGIMNPIQQQYNDTCAIKSQQLVLEDFGINLTEDQLVQIASENGWYDGNGTALEDVGKLLIQSDIPVTQMSDANIYTLVGELAQGHKVIVGVDSDELWNKGIMTTAKDLFVGETPNHALLVSGIDTTDPDNVQVVVTDPGSGEYCKSYPLSDFMDAWKDSHCFMVSTDIPAPLDYNPEMIHFDYSEGHLPVVGEMNYDQFDQQILPLADSLPPHPEVFQQFFDEFSVMANMNPVDFSHELATDFHFQNDSMSDNDIVISDDSDMDESLFNYQDLS